MSAKKPNKAVKTSGEKKRIRARFCVSYKTPAAVLVVVPRVRREAGSAVTGNSVDCDSVISARGR